MANVERKLESPPGEEIQAKQGVDNAIILITRNTDEQKFNSVEDTLSRKKDALIFNNVLLGIRGIVVAAVIGAIAAVAAGEQKLALASLGIIAISGVFLTVAAPPNPNLIKRQIAEIKTFAKKDSPAK